MKTLDESLLPIPKRNPIKAKKNSKPYLQIKTLILHGLPSPNPSFSPCSFPFLSFYFQLSHPCAYEFMA